MKQLSNTLKSIVIAAIVFLCCSPIVSFFGVETAPLSIKASALDASGKCGENVTYTFDKNTGILTFSGTGEMDCPEKFVLFISVADSIFEDSAEIKKIVVNEGITTVDRFAFRFCSNLISVELPSTLKKIGETAFEGCPKLTNVVFPEGLQTIDGAAFQNCDSITSVTTPKSLTEIGSCAFYACDNLKEVVISENVSVIETKNTFGGCPNLENITVSPDNQYFFSDECGVLCDKKEMSIFLYPRGNKRTEYKVPEGITKICSTSFWYSNNLESIKFSKSVKEIGDNAFAHCPNLKEVIIPDNIESIRRSAFSDCANLSKITIYNPDCNLESKCIPTSTKIYGIKGSTAQTYAESNGNEFIAITPCTSHSFGAWKLSSGTTCGSTGTKIRTCSICSYEETQAFTSTGHEYSTKWTVDKAATCTATGSKSYHCKNCDAKSNVTTIPATSHSYSSWKTTKKATCKTDGTKEKTCSNCGKIVKETIAKGAHSYKKQTTKATLSKNGKQTSVCTICNHTTTKTISKIASVKLSGTTYHYDGKVKTPSVVVKDSAGNTLKKDTHYTVTYPSGRKIVGTYSVVVTFKGNYSGSKSVNFTIKLGTVTNLKQNNNKSGVCVTWNSVKGATGYEVYIFDTKTNKYKLLKTFTDNSAQNPKAKGKLTIKVRACYKNKNGKIFYGDFSEAKTFTAKN